MFTGIVEEKGTVLYVGNGLITVQARKVLQGTKTGDSIAVNGVCLTVVKMNENSFTANVMPETLRRTSLGNSMGKSVNLERAMSAGGRFGGHIVSGHIDGTGVLESRRNEKNAVWYRIKCPPEIAKYIVQKGSVALDGISLTVAKVSPDNTWFEVSVIPNTESQTNLSGKKAGDMINIETDVIGKYVEKLLKTEEKDNKSTLTMEILKEMQI